MSYYHDGNRHRRASESASSYTSGIERHSSTRSGTKSFHQVEEHRDQETGARGRALKARYVQVDSECQSSSRGRSLSLAKNLERSRSKSKHDPERSHLPPSEVPSCHSRGRSVSKARSVSRAPSKTRIVIHHEAASPENQKDQEDCIRTHSSSTNSKSRTRSQSNAQPKSSRRIERPSDDYLERQIVSANVETSIVRRQKPLATSRVSQSSEQVSGSRKFIVEIDGKSNDIIGVNEVLDHDIVLSTDGVQLASTMNQPTRSRSRSILRSSAHNGSITSQERVTFAPDKEIFCDNVRSFSFLNESDISEHRGRDKANVDNSSTQRSRSLATSHRLPICNVDFDPRIKNQLQEQYKDKKNLSTLLQKPERPYEFRWNHRSSLTTSNTTQETTLTIDDDDDSFAATTQNTMRDLMFHSSMESVVEEYDTEESVLSDCQPHLMSRNYETRVSSLLTDPLSLANLGHITSKGSSEERSARFRDKLKPVTFQIARKLNKKRQTVPYGAEMSSITESERDDSAVRSKQLSPMQEYWKTEKAWSRLSRLALR